MPRIQIPSASRLGHTVTFILITDTHTVPLNFNGFLRPCGRSLLRIHAGHLLASRAALSKTFLTIPLKPMLHLPVLCVQFKRPVLERNLLIVSEKDGALLHKNLPHAVRIHPNSSFCMTRRSHLNKITPRPDVGRHMQHSRCVVWQHPA